jgi:threonylcarbamoyladenosine tRNA methylthiotransferase MtaB
MSPPKVSFTTLGCRLNQAESDSMGEQLAERGFEAAESGEEPDLVIVNTCTVTKEATKASRMAIRRAVRAHPNSKVVAAGCYAVSNPEEIEAIDGVDAILTNTDKEQVVEALGLRGRTTPLLEIGGLPSSERRLPYRVRANLKVQTGCDEWCTFCIIPTTRGPLRSMDADVLVAEARAKVEAGAREIVLTGVHLGKFAYDLGGNESDLIALLRRLLDIDGVWRLRLSSILSQHLTPEFIEFMASNERICRHLHVPLQSGDPGILAAMHRPYRIEDYMAHVKWAVDAMPELALATDIIVGFPGESDWAFEKTMDAVRELRFSKLHVFRYSPRAQTAAADMPDAVPIEVKKERSKKLIDLGNEIRAEFLAAHLEKRLRLLVEDERVVTDAEGTSNVCSGQTDDYVRVWFEGRGVLGTMVEVEGGEVRADGIRGAALVAQTRR